MAKKKAKKADKKKKQPKPAKSKKPVKPKKPAKAKEPEKKEEPKTEEKEETGGGEAGEEKEEPQEDKGEEGGEGEKEEKPQTIGDIVEEEGLVSEPDRESMLGKEGQPELSEILMRIDRIDGKLELFKGMLDSFGERMVEVNERLGDTRRMVFDREKWASRIETEFDKVKDIVKELDPEKIVLKFEKFDSRLGKQEARGERMEDLLENTSERLKMVEKKLGDIKSIQNIS